MNNLLLASAQPLTSQQIITYLVIALIPLLYINVLSAIMCGVYAADKNRDVVDWVIFGVFFNFIAWIIAAAVPSKVKMKTLEESTCSKWTCRICGADNALSDGFCKACGKHRSERIPQEVLKERERIESAKILRERSEFTGSFWGMFGRSILCYLICSVSYGIAAPWAIAKFVKWKTENTVYNGKKLIFVGSGKKLFWSWIRWMTFGVITLGVYFFFLPCRIDRWKTANTFFEDEYVSDQIAKEKADEEDVKPCKSVFDGTMSAYAGKLIVCILFSIATFGIGAIFAICKLKRWVYEHTLINGRRLQFKGKASDIFGKWILWLFLCLVTSGVFWAFVPIKLTRWETENVVYSIKVEKIED